MTQAERTPILGVDVGGVIVDRQANDLSDTSLVGDHYLESRSVTAAFAALARLNAGAFKDRVWIVSKCGHKVEAKTRAWLAHQEFFERTGIPETSLRFVRTRQDKGPEAERLKISHFVDDRLEVLSYMPPSVLHRVLFRPQLGEVRDHWKAFAGVYVADDWMNLAAWLEETVGWKRVSP